MVEYGLSELFVFIIIDKARAKQYTTNMCLYHENPLLPRLKKNGGGKKMAGDDFFSRLSFAQAINKSDSDSGMSGGNGKGTEVDNDSGEGGGERLASLRNAPDLGVAGAAPSRKKFAPKIPVRSLVKLENSQAVGEGGGAGGGSGDVGSRSPRKDGGGRGGRGRGERGRGRGRGAMSAPVVTFRATGGPQPTSAGRGGPAGAGFSAAYSSGTGAEKSSKAPAAGASGGGGAAAGAQFMNNASQYDDVEVDCSLLPTTLPLTTMAPWLTEPAMVSDEMLHSKKALRKLVRSISTKAAQDILGEHIYAAILRGAVTDKFTPASIGLTKDLVAKLETRRLQENPLAQSQAAESRLSEGQILAAKAQLEASGLPEALNPNLIQHIKKAADFLMPTGCNQLLLFRLPTRMLTYADVCYVC